MSANHPAWYCERIPSLSASAEAPDLVLLHGWGMSGEVWRGWLRLLRIRCNVILLDLPGFGRSAPQPYLSLDELLDQLKNYVPARAVLLGWSLGGALALAFTQKYREHCSAVMTIASNPCFVARHDWPTGMTPADFSGFQQALANNPRVTLKRFLGLQVTSGDNERELLRWLRLQSVAEDKDVLLWGLELLAQLDMRDALKNSRLLGAHIFGSCDALIPVQVAPAVAALAPNHWSILIDGAAHLPFVSHSELCWQHLDRLLAMAKLLPRAAAPQREKKSVAASFSRAANSYDGAAGLQRDVATQLLAQSGWLSARDDLRAGSRVLDIGCGTGVVSAQLAMTNDVVALDLAPGMLDFGRTHHSTPALQWLCGDAENLPLANQSIDAVFSSLAVQWCENLGAVFIELERVLRSGGTVSLSTLGPSTLMELREAWSAVDGYAHVNRFSDRTAIETALARTGLTITSWREEVRVLRYQELRELTRELKEIGAHNVNSARPDGLTSRVRLQRFSEAYEARRDAEGMLPATYQVWYLQLVKN
ncbi:MAG: malonyl-ACP O-methyltransferase BioC [Spongiibacteraceae bacterium]